MRRRLAWVFVALSIMLTVGFLVPLGISVKSQAKLRGVATAQSDARGVATAVAAVAGATGEAPDISEVEFILNTYGTDKLVVVLPDGTEVGEIPYELTSLPISDAGSIVVDVDGGAVALVPVAFADYEKPYVVASFVSNKDLQGGVTTSWLILLALGLIVVFGSVPLADRFAASLVKPMKNLSDAAHKWASGDLQARVSPSGPAEIAESGRAFNLLAERLTGLLSAERERVADLSHRLRTPLAALRLQVESVDNESQKSALISDIANLEGEVTALIEDVRRSDEKQPSISDLATVITQRMGFWQVVAAAQNRELTIECPQGQEILVGSSDAEVLTVLDNLIQNVLTHTPTGIGFHVTVKNEPPSLTVTDEGEGLSSPDVFDRGSSTGESSGLGLDIVRRIAESSGGDVRIGEVSGANIIVKFGQAN